MDERRALDEIAAWLPAAGDDAAVVGDRVLTTDMLHERTDFPEGVSKYTAGWRAVGASLSDVAAMGASATAAVAVYAAPEFEKGDLADFVEGASDVCERCGAEYVGGDLDSHEEFTVATTALGRVQTPTYRSGATPGDRIYLTGTLGRSAGGMKRFEAGEIERANELFRFSPRVNAGTSLGAHASAMMDVSDGLARSLHQLAAASDCGFAVESPLPIDDRLREIAGPDEARELGTTFGEDFELLFTIPETASDIVESLSLATQLTAIGRVTDEGVTLDGEALADRGYDHG